MDCDGDGQTNATECTNNTDPLDPCSNTYTTAATLCAYVTANPTSPLALADCDNGGIINIIECQNGGDPLDPADDCACDQQWCSRYLCDLGSKSNKPIGKC
ncbi:MAG: hypothetical protein IPH96_13230 [Saprospiraceae bacterium]|nr:hypothetical protein [Saprospiraceae bacterium]